VKPDVVITTLNAPRASDSPFAKPIAPPRFMADAIANICEVMKANGVTKIIIMSAFGVGDSFQNLNFLMKPIISYTNMAKQFNDHNLVDSEIRKSGLDWTLVRPAMLNGEEALPVKIMESDGKGAGFMPSVSRESVAVFMVQAAETSEWINKSPVIYN